MDNTTSRWIETVLANDESSTDEQLVSYFVVNGLTEAKARELVEQRTGTLNRGFHPCTETGAPLPSSLMLKCRRCGHTWLRRNLDKLPGNCARCKSPYWNRPRLTGK